MLMCVFNRKEKNADYVRKETERMGLINREKNDKKGRAINLVRTVVCPTKVLQ